ncbi:ABC transporter ATP-binding protein [Micromonospora sp. U56]|jgi:branched-chain amino acid transport system ATP-binding protein|uniref:ABC transporter ATP-binding protein n=1 Tax=unclassified Micromonospora TaxID=2617518 RepID=UPI001B362F88|nr:ABC transporter ATP-binding protein [Micromonospora sp. U56]MBQ0894879.1 ABC transporter ATP-binding protein [Micromonospora sp. U56]
MSLLVLEDVAGGYPGTRVLDGVDLTVDEGGVLVLLGRNGVGKSTLVHTLMGMLRGTGSISFDGKQLLGLPTHAVARSGLALVPQGRRVFAPLTVDENLRIAAAHARDGRWTPQEIYRLFPRLEERRRNWAGQLSGGEQEMLSIGRALVTNPRLLIMDEPSDGLAPSIVNLVGDVIQSLAAEGVTVMLVEQNLALALRVADQVAVMSKGRVTFNGRPDDLRHDAARVRDLLGVG